MIVRIILFGLFFYLIYFLLKYMFIKPFREGYAGHDRRSGKGWNNPFKNPREGEVTVTYNPQKNRKDDKKIGEYIDYEEVD